MIVLCNVAKEEGHANHDARAEQHERDHDGPELEHQPVDGGVGCERHKGDLALGFVLQPPGELVYGPDPRQVCGRAQEQAIGCVWTAVVADARTFWVKEDGELVGEFQVVVEETETGLGQAVLLLVHCRFIEPVEGPVVASGPQHSQDLGAARRENGVRDEVQPHWGGDDHERRQQVEKDCHEDRDAHDHLVKEAQLRVCHEGVCRLKRVGSPPMADKTADRFDWRG